MKNINLYDELISADNDTVNKLNLFDVEIMNQQNLYSIQKKSDCFNWSDWSELVWKKTHVKKVK